MLLAEIAPLISSNFLATDVAADFKLLSPPIMSSLDFFDVRLLGLGMTKEIIKVNTCHVSTMYLVHEKVYDLGSYFAIARCVLRGFFRI